MKKSALICTIIIFLAAPLVQAQMEQGFFPKAPRSMRHSFGHGSRQCDLLGCKDKLNLTDEQVGKIQQIGFDHRNLMIDFKAELQKLRLSKQREMRSYDPDKTEILVLTRKTNEVRGKIAEAKVEHQFALRGVLSKEQFEKWQECRHQCRSRCGDVPGSGRRGAGFERGPSGYGRR